MSLVYSSESKTEPVMKLILDRDGYEYDYDDNHTDGEAVKFRIYIYIVFMTKPFR